MRIAVLSDIHGNLGACKCSVVADACYTYDRPDLEVSPGAGARSCEFNALAPRLGSYSAVSHRQWMKGFCPELYGATRGNAVFIFALPYRNHP
jgi:hypothetical protein